jgi:cytochrome c biogenesis protein CcmG/thiol:disulfide interchange protein DsbE
MARKTQLYPWILVILLAGSIGALLMAGSRGPAENLAVSSPDEPLNLADLPILRDPGDTREPASLSGQVMLLNVWASWCVTCRIEHPLLMELSADQGLNLYGLNYLDERHDALRWLEFYGDPYRVSLSDTNGRYGRQLGLVGVPETYLIDGTGRIRYRHVGALTREVWHENIRPLLDELEGGL